eukprot:3236307-Karenia_brevis.AAC.1
MRRKIGTYKKRTALVLADVLFHVLMDERNDHSGPLDHLLNYMNYSEIDEQDSIECFGSRLTQLVSGDAARIFE